VAGSAALARDLIAILNPRGGGGRIGRRHLLVNLEYLISAWVGTVLSI
jgi:hypothetical protein